MALKQPLINRGKP